MDTQTRTHTNTQAGLCVPTHPLLALEGSSESLPVPWFIAHDLPCTKHRPVKTTQPQPRRLKIITHTHTLTHSHTHSHTHTLIHSHTHTLTHIRNVPSMLLVVKFALDALMEEGVHTGVCLTVTLLLTAALTTPPPPLCSSLSSAPCPCFAPALATAFAAASTPRTSTALSSRRRRRWWWCFSVQAGACKVPVRARLCVCTEGLNTQAVGFQALCTRSKGGQCRRQAVYHQLRRNLLQQYTRTCTHTHTHAHRLTHTHTHTHTD